jgi:nicotinate-nucleotide adenylyltransferase
MEIALFGGSFDPPHAGHLLAAAYVLATEPCDELWLLPVYEHPFGKRFRASFEQRVELCEAALGAVGMARARVSRLEETLARAGGEGRTVELLEHLAAQRPADRFALVVGSDLLAETAQWKSFDRVRALARLVVLERGGYPTGALAPTIPEISSTRVRELLAEGRDASRFLARPALERILRWGCYGGGTG